MGAGQQASVRPGQLWCYGGDHLYLIIERLATGSYDHQIDWLVLVGGRMRVFYNEGILDDEHNELISDAPGECGSLA